MISIYRWIDERADLTRTLSPLLFRKIPRGVGWWYTFGSATLFTFVLQAVTGIFLGMYYSPSPDHAYDSVRYISEEAALGSFIRGLHHWGASAMVVLVVLHLLLLTLGFGFTGYLLPWDEKAYWATTVGTNMAGTVPIVGGHLLKLLRGGAELGAVTLTRFYALHVLLLPALTAGLIGVHLYLVVKQGISAPPDMMTGREDSRYITVQGRR